MTELKTIRLESVKPDQTENNGFVEVGVYTPGIIRWAKEGFNPKETALARALAKAFNIDSGVMIALLSGEVDYTVEDDAVVFKWPCDPQEKI